MAGAFALHIGIADAPGLGRSISCAASQDTGQFLRINRLIWRRTWRRGVLQGQSILSVGVHLTHLEQLERRNGDLLLGLRAGQMTKGERVSEAMDAVNRRFGAGSIKRGLNQPHPGFFERG